MPNFLLIMALAIMLGLYAFAFDFDGHKHEWIFVLALSIGFTWFCAYMIIDEEIEKEFVVPIYESPIGQYIISNGEIVNIAKKIGHHVDADMYDIRVVEYKTIYFGIMSMKNVESDNIEYIVVDKSPRNKNNIDSDMGREYGKCKR